MKRKIWSILIAFILLFQAAPNLEVFANNKDITSKVTVQSVRLYGQQLDNTYALIVENDVATGAQFYRNHLVRFEIDWEVLPENMEYVEAGNYFIIDFPTGYFEIPDTGLKDLNNTETGEKIGEWLIENGHLKVTFNDIAASKQFLANGFFSIDGYAKKVENTIEINIGGIDLGDFDIIVPPIDWQNHNPDMHVRKLGRQLPNNDQMKWEMHVNFVNAAAAYNNESYTPWNNVILMDDLGISQSFKNNEINIVTPLYYAMPDSPKSSRTWLWQEVSTQFTVLEQTATETYEEFYDRVVSYTSPAYGIYNAKQLVMSFGNLPSAGNGIKLPINDLELRALLQSKVDIGEITQQQADWTFDANYSGNNLQGDRLGFIVIFDTDVTQETGEITNDVKVKYNNVDEDTDSAMLEYVKVSSGVRPGEAGDVELIKTDAHSKALLEGVTFKLQKKNISGNYEDYIDSEGILEKKTGEDGRVLFTKLSLGEYKIIEVATLPGYTSEVTYAPSDSFIISGNETRVITLGAVNYLQQIGDVTLSKTDAQSGAELQGVTFTLQTQAGEYVSGPHTTNTAGKISLVDLPIGLYQFVETAALPGYVLDATPVGFEITAGQIAAVEVSKTNETKVFGNVTLSKTDAQSGAELQGVTFTLQTQAGEYVSGPHTTNADGEISLANLPIGLYQFVETAALPGYVLDATPVRFEITAGQTGAVELSKTNKKETAVLPVTGENTKELMMYAIWITSISLIVITKQFTIKRGKS